MARNITAALATEFDAATLRPIFLAKFEFPAATEYYWTGVGTKSWNGDDYTGLGDLTGIKFPTEDAGGSASGAVFTLSGIPSATISLAHTDDYRNRACSVWIGALDSADAIIADPYLMFAGLMDVIEVSDDGVTASVSLKAEGFAYGVGPNNRRYTNEDQKREHATDIGLDHMAGLVNKEIVWFSEGAGKHPKADYPYVTPRNWQHWSGADLP